MSLCRAHDIIILEFQFSLNVQLPIYNCMPREAHIAPLGLHDRIVELWNGVGIYLIWS